MKYSDMDGSTRSVIFWAHIMTQMPSNRALRNLKIAVEKHDKAHEQERMENLLKAVFDEEVV